MIFWRYQVDGCHAGLMSFFDLSIDTSTSFYLFIFEDLAIVFIYIWCLIV